jgi:cell division protein FtsZ
MDEVEIIQQYLLNNAGPETDVILGMGYDNGLGSQIGITLIATGFEHKNPFDRPGKAVDQTEKKDEKIILTLDSKEPEKVQIIPVSVVSEEKDEMAPMLVDLSQNTGIQFIVESEMEDSPVAPEVEIMHFELSSLSSFSTDQIPTEDLPLEVPAFVNQPTSFSKTEDKEASSTLTSGGFLARPSNIYAEDPIHLESNHQDSLEELHQEQKEADPTSDMQLVIKENLAADESGAPSTHITMAPVEEPALQDETEDQRRKAAERLHKLRNLSFNMNAADPNNEFENVPAYIRRNLQVHNTTLTSVEKFYSNYTVKADDNNQGQISTLNTFLEGKKPD